MTQFPEPDLNGSKLRLAIVVAKFNGHITSRLLSGALEAAKHHGVEQLFWHFVPGAFELPIVALKLAKSKRCDAIVCLGCVVRHETDHYKYIAGEAASGVARVALDTGVPCSFGVLTCDTEQQALDRSQLEPEGRNAGRDAVLAAIETANLLRSL